MKKQKLDQLKAIKREIIDSSRALGIQSDGTDCSLKNRSIVGERRMHMIDTVRSSFDHDFYDKSKAIICSMSPQIDEAKQRDSDQTADQKVNDLLENIPHLARQIRDEQKQIVIQKVKISQI